MKKILFPLFFFVGSFCFGQSYIPILERYDSVRWSNIFRWSALTEPISGVYTKYTVIDSTINFQSKKYRVFQFQDNNRPNDFFLVREDTIERKVYLFNQHEETEYLIYDFNLEEGDVFELKIFPYSLTPIHFCFAEVVKVQTVNYFGIRRKTISLKFLDSFGCTMPRNDLIFIEGLGSNNGFDYFFLDYWGFDIEHPEILCAFKNGKQVYGNDTCYIYRNTNVDESSAKEKISLFPNPVQDKFSINIPPIYRRGLEWQLFTITGEKVKTEIINHFTQSIDLQSMASGIYFYQIIENGHVVQSDKLVITN